MARDRDVAAFGDARKAMTRAGVAGCITRSPSCTADLARTCVPVPKRILDVGCGTGYLLGRLAACAPQGEVLAGIDAAPA